MRKLTQERTSRHEEQRCIVNRRELKSYYSQINKSPKATRKTSEVNPNNSTYTTTDKTGISTFVQLGSKGRNPRDWNFFRTSKPWVIKKLMEETIMTDFEKLVVTKSKATVHAEAILYKKRFSQISKSKFEKKLKPIAIGKNRAKTAE